MFFCYAYHRDLFDGIRFPRYIRGEDRWVLNKIQLERINSIMATETPLYGYRQRVGSAMNTVPSRQVLCDEMDHRLDIMEMIDASDKTVEYAGNDWLEQYFTKNIRRYLRYLDKDTTKLVVNEWRNRLVRFEKLKCLSNWGRFVARSCLLCNSNLWDYIICDTIPRMQESPKLHKLARIIKAGKLCSRFA